MRNGKNKHVSMFPSAESSKAFLKSKIWSKPISTCLDTECVCKLSTDVYRWSPADVVVTSRRITQGFF